MLHHYVSSMLCEEEEWSLKGKRTEGSKPTREKDQKDVSREFNRPLDQKTYMRSEKLNWWLNRTLGLERLREGLVKFVLAGMTEILDSIQATKEKDQEEIESLLECIHEENPEEERSLKRKIQEVFQPTSEKNQKSLRGIENPWERSREKYQKEEPSFECEIPEVVEFSREFDQIGNPWEWSREKYQEEERSFERKRAEVVEFSSEFDQIKRKSLLERSREENQEEGRSFKRHIQELRQPSIVKNQKSLHGIEFYDDVTLGDQMYGSVDLVCQDIIYLNGNPWEWGRENYLEEKYQEEEQSFERERPQVVGFSREFDHIESMRNRNVYGNFIMLHKSGSVDSMGISSFEKTDLPGTFKLERGREEKQEKLRSLEPKVEILKKALHSIDENDQKDENWVKEAYQRKQIRKKEQNQPLERKKLKDIEYHKGDARKELQELEHLLKCKVCLDKDSCMIFFPCRHMATCESCEGFLQRCPVCRSPINESVKINED